MEVQPPLDAKLIALRELGAALRDMIHMSAETTASPELLMSIAEDAKRLHRRLAEAPRGRDPEDASGIPASLSERTMEERSPTVGLCNPLAPPLLLTTDGETIEGVATFGTACAGPAGYVHGGVIAATFDGILGTLTRKGRSTVTASLTIRYRRPTPLHRQVQLSGRVTQTEGKRVTATAAIHAGDELCAEGEGLFILMDHAALKPPQQS